MVKSVFCIQKQKNSIASLKNNTDASVASARFSNYATLLNRFCLFLNPVFESLPSPPAYVFVFQPQNKHDYQSDFNGQDLHRWNSGAMRR